MDLVFSYLSAMCGSNPEIYNHGFLGYQAAAEWHPYGIKVMWDLDMGNRMRHGNRILLQIGGTGLGCFPATSLHQFCNDLCSKFFFRCSRTDLESDGEVDAVRWEVEFSKERANAVFFELAMSSDVTEFATKLAMFIGGSIDFIEHNGKRSDPIDRLAFCEMGRSFCNTIAGKDSPSNWR